MPTVWNFIKTIKFNKHENLSKKFLEIKNFIKKQNLQNKIYKIFKLLKFKELKSVKRPKKSSENISVKNSCNIWLIVRKSCH